jgi:hypothetical protein
LFKKKRKQCFRFFLSFPPPKYILFPLAKAIRFCEGSAHRRVFAETEMRLKKNKTKSVRSGEIYGSTTPQAPSLAP